MTAGLWRVDVFQKVDTDRVDVDLRASLPYRSEEYPPGFTYIGKTDGLLAVIVDADPGVLPGYAETYMQMQRSTVEATLRAMRERAL